jgi:hypothetical protein
MGGPPGAWAPRAAAVQPLCSAQSHPDLSGCPWARVVHQSLPWDPHLVRQRQPELHLSAQRGKGPLLVQRPFQQECRVGVGASSIGVFALVEEQGASLTLATQLLGTLREGRREGAAGCGRGAVGVRSPDHGLLESHLTRW